MSINLCEYLPILSRQDKQQAVNELKSKDTETLINLIYGLYDETQRLIKLMPPPNKGMEKSFQAQNNNDEKYQELSSRFANLMSDYQGLFYNYHQNFQNHTQIINACYSFIANLQQQAQQLQQKLVTHSEQIIRLQGDINLEIISDQEYKQINELNKTSKDIQQERSNLLISLEQLHHQNVSQNQEIYQEKISQDQIQNIIVLIKQFQSKTEKYLQASQNFLEQLQSENQREIRKQVIHNQQILQYNIAVFKKLELILPVFITEIKQFQEQADQYKIQLEKQKKLTKIYLQKIEEYKKQNEEIIKAKIEKNLQRIYPYDNQKSIEIFYKIQTSFFSLAIILIDQQHFQESPDLTKVLQILKGQTQSKNKLENYTSLFEYSKKLKTDLFELTNFIRKNNKLEEILISLDQFYKAYFELIKQLSQ